MLISLQKSSKTIPVIRWIMWSLQWSAQLQKMVWEAYWSSACSSINDFICHIEWCVLLVKIYFYCQDLFCVESSTVGLMRGQFEASQRNETWTASVPRDVRDVFPNWSRPGIEVSNGDHEDNNVILHNKLVQNVPKSCYCLPLPPTHPY